MKKGILILSVLCFSFASMAQAQEEERQPQKADTVEIKGVHPYKVEENENGIKPEIAHWSIIPHIGFSAVDGDFTSEMKHNVAIPSLGLGLEYAFTPVWNLGIEYMYDMYTVTGKTDGELKKYNADTLLTGHMHKAGAYLSMDIINLFFPRVEKKIVSLFPYVGGGAAWYKRAKYYYDDKYYDAEKGMWINPSHGRGNTANYINADGEVGPDHDSTYNCLGYIQAGVNLEFNLNRTLALGLRANYTYFTRDYMDGRGYHKQSASSYASKNNDGIFDVTLNLRFKLEAVSKSHPRNMPSFDAFDKLLAQAEPVEPCHDTVIIRHDSVIVREIVKEVVKQAPRKEIFNVYFDNDKSVIRQDGLVTVSQVAERMDGDKELYAVVIGYCDNTGSNGHNFGLGDRRANSVVDELEQEYNIPSDHLYGKGSGKLVGRRSKKSYGPNRRAAIHLVDEETFELMKMELNDKSENRDEKTEPTYESARPVSIPDLKEAEKEDAANDSVQTIPLTESARKEKINEYKVRHGDTITVEKGMTLSKLARKYYDNSQCWVYIYMANSDTMATPSDFKEGMEILIPELTEEEIQIKNKECIRLYSITAHQNRAK